MKRASVVAIAMALFLAGCWVTPGYGPHRDAHSALPSGIDAGNVHSLTPVWAHAFGAGPGRTPIIGIGRVHVTDGLSIATLDLATGNELWRQVVGVSGDPKSTLADPTLDKTRVLVPVTGVPGPSAGPVGSELRGFDAATGAPLGPVGIGGFESAILNGPKLVASFFQNDEIRLYSVHVTDLSDSSKSWSTFLSFPNSDLVPTSPAVGTDRFVLGLGTTVEAFPIAAPAPSTCPAPRPGLDICTPQWSVDVGSTPSFPVLSPDEQTVFVTNATGRLFALDATNGHVRWFADVGATSPAALDATSVFVTTDAATLAAFPQTGCTTSPCAPAWRGVTGSISTKVQPAVADGVVYTGSGDGFLRAFAAAGCGTSFCTPLFAAVTGSAITGSPAVAQGHVVFGTADGKIRAYALPPAG